MKNVVLPIIFHLVLLPGIVFSQNIRGIVYETHEDHDGHQRSTPEKPHLTTLPGANVYWAGTTVGATTDTSGRFVLPLHAGKKLVISYVGFKNDTISISDPGKEVQIVLSENAQLSEVVIHDMLPGSYMSRLKPIGTQIISSAGLTKAACCNLAESFQSSASVDVSYSDAVTGARQVKLLGLSGIYSQIMTENIPNIRGLSTPFGIGYIPGPWMESIQVSKGVASVINGNESISGQINIELKKPETAEDLYINGYLSSDMKAEVNADAVISPGKGWTSLFLIHGENNSEPIDNNKDNFLDIPMTKQLHFMNRWDYENHGKYESKTAIQLMTEDRTGGTIPGTENQATDYPISIKNNRAHFFTKNGFVSQKPGTSLGTIVSGTYHDVQANIGNNKYSGLQKSVYANLIYQTIIKNTNHEISSGASFNGDDYSESLNDSTFARTDIIPGAFVQYTWRHLDNITLMAAYRADYNSSFGVFHTPRVHLRYAPVKNHTFRLSAGKGYRIPSVIAENMGYLASSRELTVLEEAKPEDAINAGISYFWEFKINGNTSSFVADYFHTYFINMYNADPDLDARHIYFYNVHNNARANSYQAELNLQPVKRLEVLLAARYNDVMGFSGNKIQAKPLVSPFKMVASVSYRTKFDKWQFDGTVHHLGGGRIPVTTGNPAEFTRSNKFPSYSTVYAQITRRFKHWEWYLGGENLTNFKQKDPVIAASDPNGQFFDASLIWGPVQGRMLYFGFRFILK